jgi:cytoskeleton protein RodZ
MGRTHAVGVHDVSTNASRTIGHPAGARLQSARTERGLTIEDVSARVLLSPSQIRGLEQGDVRAFYSSHFYNQGLRKYAALLGVPDVAPADGASQDHESTAHAHASDGTPRAERRSGAAAIVATLVIVMGAAAGGAWWWQVRALPGTGPGTVVDGAANAVADTAAADVVALPPVPAAPTIVTPPELTPIVEPLPDVEATAAADATGPAATTATTAPAAPAALTPAGAYGTLRVNTATWIYVRYADGTMIERTLPAGAVHTIALHPTYLAAGSSDVVLTVGSTPVDVAPWVSNGQVRISGRAFTGPPLLSDPATP